MTGIAAILVGLVMTGLGWLTARRGARAPLRLTGTLVLDLAAPFGLWAVLFAATARPLFAGTVSLAVFAGFAFADATKRATLQEPVVFSDMSEFIELFRHPRLYLPYAGTAIVVGGTAAIFIGLAAMLIWEPGRWSWSPLPGLFALAIVAAIVLTASREPALSRCAELARRTHPQADPEADAARLGPLAMLLVYGVIARAERSERRPLVAAPQLAPRPRSSAPPIVLTQCESFFDARRLSPAIPTDLLPAFARCVRTGVQAGRFGVSGWGAYTIRAELAALTGLTDETLGFDRWNPYHAFVGTPLPSLARHLREEGYRTVCLHPFDRTYYGRDRILPLLGFDAFLGEEAFAGAARVGPFIADAEVARRAGEILRADGRGLFLFIITMENHGPWTRSDPRFALPDPAPRMPDFARRDELRCYLQGLKSTDAMLGSLCDTLSEGPGGLLAAYGDHLPSLPETFRALGFTERGTDYVIWQARGDGPAVRIDLAAHELPAAILTARAALAQGAVPSA